MIKFIYETGEIREIGDYDPCPKNFTGNVEHSKGEKRWYQNGKLHRLDGPAIEKSNGTKIWYKNGMFHRLDGPAYIETKGFNSHYINGKQYSKQEFKKAINLLFPNKTIEELRHLNSIMNPIIVQQLIDNELKCNEVLAIQLKKRNRKQ
jgi:hypothetical protein